MNLYKFVDGDYTDIPKEKNPVYKSVEPDNCLILCKQLKKILGHGNFVVLLAEPKEDPLEDESLMQLGVFWELKNAELFASAYLHENS